MKKEKLDIIYQDKYIIVVNKPAKLLTIASENEKNRTLYNEIYTYEKQKHKSNKIFIVHRLDKETSGLILFAKSEKIKKILQDNWDEYAKNRIYIAIVEGILKDKENTIKSWLKETKTFLTYSSQKPNDGKLAITEYKVLSSKNNTSTLMLNLLTGRKNQIRVHLNDIGHPVIGDKKYGSKVNYLKRLGLHAYKLELVHPVTNEIINLEAKIPDEFKKYFNK